MQLIMSYRALVTFNFNSSMKKILYSVDSEFTT